MSAAEFLRRSGVADVSESGARCAEMVAEWLGGMHHFPADVRKTDWSGENVTFVMHTGGLSSFDYSELTRLVFLAHDHAIRAEIKPAMRFLRITLSPRTRDTSMTEGHPTLEEAVAAYRKRFPKEGVR